MHGTDHPYAAVQTRDGPNYNYCRYPAFVSPQSQSQSPRSPRTPACHDAQTALHYIYIHTHTGRRGRMLTHGDRHLPCVQRPHTRCLSPHPRSLTHSPCLTHTHHTTHTRGGTHPRCLIHAPCFAHACRISRTRGLFRLRCPFYTWRAGKHAFRHTRNHPTCTRGLTHTRGRFHTRGLSHTTPLTRSMRASQHASCHARAHTPQHHTHRDHTRNHTHGDTHPGDNTLHHTHGDTHAGDSRLNKSSRGLHTPPSSACTRPQLSSPRLHAARPNSPGRDRLQGGILPPLVPEGGHPAARTGSPHARRALPHCPSLPVCVCACASFSSSTPCSLSPSSRVSVYSVT